MKRDINDLVNSGEKVYDYIPDGWKVISGASTAPNGYKWYSNGKSRFSGEYERGLIKIGNN